MVIGNQTDIDALNNNFNYWLFKQDGTSVNSFGYTGTFSYTVGNTYKFAVENGKINLYEKGVLEAETDYEKVEWVNFTASSWNSIGVYAVSDEIHQYFVPGRACMLRDMLLDTCGSLAGIVAALAAVKIFSRK